MTLEGLRVLALAVECGSLSEAARRLGVSQSAVSQQVAKLEGELKVRLLERSGRGVRPTPLGEVFYRLVVDGLDSIEAARRWVREQQNEQPRKVAVVTGGTTVRHIMEEGVVGFRRCHEGVALTFVTAGSSRRCLEVVLAGGADLAFVTVTGPRPRVEQLPVVRTAWTLLVRDKAPWRAPLRPADLAAAAPLSLSAASSSGRLLHDELRRLGVNSTGETTVDDWDTAGLLVRLGFGTAIVPAIHGGRLAGQHGLRSVPLPFLAPVTFGWAARRFAALSRPAWSFVEAIHAGVASRPPTAGVEVIDPGVDPLPRVQRAEID